MLFLLDISMLTHQLFHVASIDDPYDVVERTLHRLEKIRDYFSFKFPDIKAFVCVFDNPSRELIKEGVLFDATGLIYKDGRTKHEGLDEIEAATLEAVQNSDDWQAIVAPHGFEADDVCATLAHNYSGKVFIHSEDRDYHSMLVKGRVMIVKKTNTPSIGAGLQVEYFNADMMHEKYGFGPEKWVDFQCIIGGKDNVPGWAGAGEKKAKEIIQAGVDLNELDMAQMNKTQAESYQQFRLWLPVIRFVRQPCRYTIGVVDALELRRVLV